MRIRWLRLALSDLDEIAEYISKTNTSASRKIIKTLWNNAQSLVKHPNIGRQGRVHGTRELIISGTNYIIPYRVIDEEIQILRVLHASRKWPTNL